MNDTTRRRAAAARALDEIYISMGYDKWTTEYHNQQGHDLRRKIAAALREAASLAGIEKFDADLAASYVEVEGEYLTLSQAAARYLVSYISTPADWRKSDNIDWAFKFMNDLFDRFSKFHRLLDGQVKGIANVALKDGIQREQRPTPSVAPAAAITDGMYKDPETGDIFKVQRAVHGSGQLYAKKLVPPSEFGGKATFEYAPGVVRKLKSEWRLTLEEAKAFGALYGTCCVCGRTLTRESSIEDGIGPICAGKL